MFSFLWINIFWLKGFVFNMCFMGLVAIAMHTGRSDATAVTHRTNVFIIIIIYTKVLLFKETESINYKQLIENLHMCTIVYYFFPFPLPKHKYMEKELFCSSNSLIKKFLTQVT
jgi:hypothetical protein